LLEALWSFRRNETPAPAPRFPPDGLTPKAGPIPQGTFWRLLWLRRRKRMSSPCSRKGVWSRSPWHPNRLLRFRSGSGASGSGFFVSWPAGNGLPRRGSPGPP